MKDNMLAKKFKVHIESQDSEKNMIFNIRKIAILESNAIPREGCW